MNVILMNKVEQAAGSKAKVELLRGADEITKLGIKYATDTFMTFGVTHDAPGAFDAETADIDNKLFGARKSQSDTGARDINPTLWWRMGFKLLDGLVARELRGHAASEAVNRWLTAAPNLDHAKWAVRVINKDLRCGVSQGIVQKIWPGLIEPFAVSLAHPYREETLEAGFLEPKLDGLRMVVLDGVAYSRKGHVLHGVDHIIDLLRRADLLDWVWDGECLDPDKSFEETSGMLRKSNGDKSGGLVFHAFDVLDRSDWRTKITPDTFQRKADLRELTRQAGLPRNGPVRPILGQLYQKPTMDDAITARDKFLALGFEGAMYKRGAAPYQFKRSHDVLKIKRFDTMDVKVMDVVEGSGKYAGVLGAFVVEMPDGMRYNVGTGYNDEQRAVLWKERELLIGKTIEVKFQNLTNKGRARFPVFLRLRPDKDE